MVDSGYEDGPSEKMVEWLALSPTTHTVHHRTKASKTEVLGDSLPFLAKSLWMLVVTAYLNPDVVVMIHESSTPTSLDIMKCHFIGPTMH